MLRTYQSLVHYLHHCHFTAATGNMPINFVTAAELETLQRENKHFLKGERQEKRDEWIKS